jgi:hypothetical protein
MAPVQAARVPAPPIRTAAMPAAPLQAPPVQARQMQPPAQVQQASVQGGSLLAVGRGSVFAPIPQPTPLNAPRYSYGN